MGSTQSTWGAFKRICENAFDKKGNKLSLSMQMKLYDRKAHPGTLITKRIGSNYTASCYTNLYSMLFHESRRSGAISGENSPNSLSGRTFVVYSYGSGSASGMYRLRSRVPQFVSGGMGVFFGLMEAEDSLSTGRHDFEQQNSINLPIDRYLDRRTKNTPEAYIRKIEEYSNT